MTTSAHAHMHSDASSPEAPITIMKPGVRTDVARHRGVMPPGAMKESHDVAAMNGAQPREHRILRPSRVPVIDHTADSPTGGSGTPLDSATRQSMERSFRSDFGEVRLYTGQDAAAVAATHSSHAMTVGANIFFGAGKYAPASRAGRHLLAHELAHVIQQRRASMGSGDSVQSVDVAAEEAARQVDRGVAAVHVRGVAGPGIWRASSGEFSEVEPIPVVGGGPSQEPSLHMGKLLDTTLQPPSILPSAADVLAEPLKLELTPVATVLAEIREEKRLEPIVKAEFRGLPKGMIENARTPEQYAELVRKTFGSYRSYYDFAEVSDIELDEPIGKRKKPLRTYIQKEGLPGHAQTVFYRWVRKAYISRGLDPVSMIEAQGGGEIMTRVAKARQTTGEKIAAEGFNPRPMKGTHGGYVLGTLSEHGSGEATDIDPYHNLFVSNKAWLYIEQQTGMHVVTSRERWRDHPEDLYDDVDQLSRQWADYAQHLVAAELLAEKSAGTMVGQLPKPDVGPSTSLFGRLLLTTESGQHQATMPSQYQATVLRALSDVPDMKDGDKVKSIYGFMKLPKAVVLALREQGLLWGVTFPSGKDVMHFEIRTDFPGEQGHGTK